MEIRKLPCPPCPVGFYFRHILHVAGDENNRFLLTLRYPYLWLAWENMKRPIGHAICLYHPLVAGRVGVNSTVRTIPVRNRVTWCLWIRWVAHSSVHISLDKRKIDLTWNHLCREIASSARRFVQRIDPRTAPIRVEEGNATPALVR